MSRTVPTTGTERQRAATYAAGLFLANEIHTTSDQKRAWMGGNKLISGGRHLGTVANQAAMLALSTSQSNGCWPMDICYRTDTGSVWWCISNNGGLLADWVNPLTGYTVDTDGTLSANSDIKLASQKAVKTYVDTLRTYVDAAVQGLAWKASARAATTANITLSGAQTIDGVSVVATDRVLVKNQTTGSDNGIYVAASGAWTRATDADVSAEMLQAAVSIREGTTNADTLWLCTNNTITLGTTALTFTELAGGPPLAHKDSHKSGGSDAFTSSDLLDAYVKRIVESGGPNVLTVGAITDGEYLKRSGATIISGVPSGGGGTIVNTSDALILAWGPKAWYKADVGVENTAGVAATDTQTVLNWLDQSGNGYTLTQATTANKPIYRTAQQNSLPVIRFDGVNDYLNSAGFPSIDLTNHTVFIVAKSTSTTNYQRFVIIGSSGSGNDFDNLARIAYASGDTATKSFVVSCGTAQDMSLSCTGIRPTRMAVYCFQEYQKAMFYTEASTGAGNSGASATLGSSQPGLLLGCEYLAGAISPTSVPLAGDFAELVIFAKTLTNSTIGQIAQALKTKWAV